MSRRAQGRVLAPLPPRLPRVRGRGRGRTRNSAGGRGPLPRVSAGGRGSFALGVCRRGAFAWGCGISVRCGIEPPRPDRPEGKL